MTPVPPSAGAPAPVRRRLSAAADILLLLLLLLLPLAAACGDARDEATLADTPPPQPLVEAPEAALAGADSGADTGGTGAAAVEDCPMAGLWRRCSVEERLERSGFGLRSLPEPAHQPGLAIAGHAYRIGDAELQLFLYADSASARREAGALDPGDAEPVDARGIRRPPAVIRSANLVALLFNNNDRQKERVVLSLTAGLPAR